MKRSLAAAVAAIVLVAVPAAALAADGPNLSDIQLVDIAVHARNTSACGDAHASAVALALAYRAPSLNLLHGNAANQLKCAREGALGPAQYNETIVAAGASLLLAARHETGDVARQDAQAALALANTNWHIHGGPDIGVVYNRFEMPSPPDSQSTTTVTYVRSAVHVPGRYDTIPVNTTIVEELRSDAAAILHG